MANKYKKQTLIILSCASLFFGGSANSAEGSCSDNLKNTLTAFYQNTHDEWVPDRICYDQFKVAINAARSCHEALNLVPQKMFFLTPAAVLKEIYAAVKRYSKRKNSNYIACENVMKNNWVTPINESCSGAFREASNVEEFDDSCVKI